VRNKVLREKQNLTNSQRRQQQREWKMLSVIDHIVDRRKDKEHDLAIRQGRDLKYGNFEGWLPNEITATLDKTARDISSTCKKGENLMDTFDECANHLKITMSKTNPLLDNMTKLLDLTSNFMDATTTHLKNLTTVAFDAVTFVRRFISIVINCFLAAPGKKLISLIVNSINLVLEYISIPNLTVTYLLSLIKGEKIEEIKGEVVEGQTLSGALQFDIPNITDSHLSVVKTIGSVLLMIFSVLFLRRLPGKSTFESLFNRLGTLGKNLTGWKIIYTESGKFLMKYLIIYVHI